MALKYNLKSGTCNSSNCNKDEYGCPQNVCPDFVIKRHDTQPSFKVSFEDCEGPMDFRGLVIEANMWALAKIKDNLEETAEYFRLADNIGFNQIMVGDVIIVDQVRSPEHMLVLSFDEHNKYIKVQRGYHGTTAGVYKKGTKIRIFRILNGQATSEMEFADEQSVDGTTKKDVLQNSSLIYEWKPEDTCLPGCYWMEFKVLKMIDMVLYVSNGNWVGETHQDVDGFYNTGSTNTNASVKLSYDQVNNKFAISQSVWQGDYHIHTDGNYYTGSVHDNGSVLLNKTGVSPSNADFNDSGIVGFHDISNISFVPSFSDESLTPENYGCVLGEGVEWVRRFPIDGEGFLIKIMYSPTTEL
jgi:hypothetical protein